MPGKRPFELTPQELQDQLEDMVDITFSDLGSEFLLMPKGNAYINYPDFRNAYEVLKRQTNAFTNFNITNATQALEENSRVFGIIRAILGMTAPEWAEIARTELESDITQNAARNLDRKCRENIDYLKSAKLNHETRLTQARLKGLTPPEMPKTLKRVADLVQVAIDLISQGAPGEQSNFIHRLAKYDTNNGLDSLAYAARENVPYAVLLYERYLGRPFAGHRDAVSEIVGEVMENAIEDQLRKAGITYRKTVRAERIPDFGQAPDFCIPDEISPAVIIEAKITNDDGTARDKVARIKELETQRNEHVAAGKADYEVVACIDGRGFRQRREDMRQLLTRLDGKVFTISTLKKLIEHTRIREFKSK